MGQVQNQGLLAVRQQCAIIWATMNNMIWSFILSYTAEGERHCQYAKIKSLICKWYKTPPIKILSLCWLCLHCDWLDCLSIDCLIWHRTTTGKSSESGLHWFLRLFNLWLCQVCNLQSKIDVYFELWFITNMSNGFVKYFKNTHKYT